MTPTEIKKNLLSSGFEVLRTLPDGVVLAERVRENQILDSGVRVRSAPDGFHLLMVMRVEKRDFPHDSEAELFTRVRELARPALTTGYEERSTRIQAVKDPSDESRTLDTFYEIVLERPVSGDFSALLDALRDALRFEKNVGGS